jgi:hypothetical protein
MPTHMMRFIRPVSLHEYACDLIDTSTRYIWNETVVIIVIHSIPLNDRDFLVIGVLDGPVHIHDGCLQNFGLLYVNRDATSTTSTGHNQTP